MFHRFLTKSYIVSFLILVVCLLPGSSLPTVKVDWVSFDKLVHLLMYVPLTWTLAYGFKLQTRFPHLQSKHLIYAFVIACVYGAFIELLQFVITPDRAAELYDFFADAVGAGIGVMTATLGMKLIFFWNRFFQKLSSIWDTKDY